MAIHDPPNASPGRRVSRAHRRGRHRLLERREGRRLDGSLVGHAAPARGDSCRPAGKPGTIPNCERGMLSRAPCPFEASGRLSTCRLQVASGEGRDGEQATTLQSPRADWFLRKTSADVARGPCKEPVNQPENEATRKTRKEADADHQKTSALQSRFKREQDEEPKEGPRPAENQTSGDAVPSRPRRRPNQAPAEDDNDEDHEASHALNEEAPEDRGCRQDKGQPDHSLKACIRTSEPLPETDTDCLFSGSCGARQTNVKGSGFSPTAAERARNGRINVRANEVLEEHLDLV